jgi:hypothetical protein
MELALQRVDMLDMLDMPVESDPALAEVAGTHLQLSQQRCQLC